MTRRLYAAVMRRVEARKYKEMVIGLGGEIDEERVEHLKALCL